MNCSPTPWCSGYPSLAHAAGGSPQPADPQHGDGGRRPVPAAALLVFPPGLRPAGERTADRWCRDGENRYHAIFGGGPARFVSASSLGPALVALGAKVKLVSAKGSREVPVAKFFVAPKTKTRARSRSSRTRFSPKSSCRRARRAERDLRGAAERGAGLAAGGRIGGAANERQRRGIREGGAGARSADAVAGRGG